MPKVLKTLCALAGGLMLMAASSAEAYTHNILLIHGRSDSSNEQFGVLTTDQHQYWQGMTPSTADGHVYFVQWDAKNKHFDDTNWPGGEAVISYAANNYCDTNKGQECWIICHSAGCAAWENYLAKSNYSSNSLLISHVMAAGSAAGGSEIADHFSWVGWTIDDSLTTSYARGAYNHNNMQSAYVRGIGGTYNDNASNCNQFPTGSSSNTGCNQCWWGARDCSDGAVALHSSCGHNRVAFFQDCNSTIAPRNDTAGTYSYHGWWITDSYCNGYNGATNCSWSGPYSSSTNWNGGFKTYTVNHGTTAKNVINEYSYAPYSLCP